MARSSDAVVKFEKATDQYIKNCQAVGLAKGTIDRYAETLSTFHRFFSDSEYRLNDPSFTTIQAYRDEMIAKGLKPSTINQKLLVLKIFWSWASDEEGANIYAKNPVSPKLSLKIPKRPYDTILTNEQIAKLWRYDYPTNYPLKTWDRDYALTMMLLTSKVRVSEVMVLTPSHLDWENEELEVDHGKGDKYRRAPFTKIAQQALLLYYYSKKKNPAPNEPIFGVMKKDSFSDAVESHVYHVTGVHNVRAHDLRHIGAYLDLNRGKPLEELQSELGHSSPITTQIYSGKLTGRKNRGDVKIVFEEMEYQMKRNEIFLKNKAPL